MKARPIDLQPYNEKIKELLIDKVYNLKTSADNKIEVKVEEYFEQPEVFPRIYISSKAFIKMTTLTQQYDKEIAWHSTVIKKDNNYLINDVLVYPQETTAVTVTSNDERYPTWLMDLPDFIFDNLRGQGHSHVDMGVSPSNTDEKLYQQLLEVTDDFYLVYIINKKGEMYTRLYDVENNTMYENLPVTVLIDKKNNTDYWYKKSLKNIVEEKRKYGPKQTSRIFQSNYYYGSY